VRAAVCACASIVLVAVAPASGVAQRTVTIALAGTGKAFWRLDAKGETARLALHYRWHGAISFAVPSLRRLSDTQAAKLRASWDGIYTSKRGGVRSTCRYRGARVVARVRARLATGRARGTFELTLHPRNGRRGFFADGRVRCSAGTSQSAPLHFAPSWFFRDNLQDHGRLSSQTAVLVLPATLLPRGSTTLTFPFESGRNDSVAVGRLAWHNRGTTVVRAR
jgi:hypothetical protein